MGVHRNSGGWLAPDLMCGCTTDGFQVGKRQRVVHVIPAGVHETAPRKHKKVFSDKKEPGRINISEVSELFLLRLQPCYIFAFHPPVESYYLLAFVSHPSCIFQFCLLKQHATVNRKRLSHVLLLILPEPTFISASWVQRKDDPDNEKIYIFFREKNSDHNPEADPWISRVARVCKVHWIREETWQTLSQP